MSGADTWEKSIRVKGTDGQMSRGGSVPGGSRSSEEASVRGMESLCTGVSMFVG